MKSVDDKKIKLRFLMNSFFIEYLFITPQSNWKIFLKENIGKFLFWKIKIKQNVLREKVIMPELDPTKIVAMGVKIIKSIFK